MELISIIVPVYNVEKYIRRCIDSIMAQTYKNLEIILIDDGSTDCSGVICDEYACLDNRIRVVHKENGGQSSARNIGLDTAKGDFISFIDSDDYVRKDFIAVLKAGITEYKADVAICDYEKGKKDHFRPWTEKRQYEVFSAPEMLDDWHGKNTRIETSPCNKMYKKYLFQRSGRRFTENRYYEDVMFTHLLISESDRIVITKEKLYYYYQRKNSTVHSLKKEKYIWDNLWAQDTRLAYFKENEYIKAYERLMIGKQKHVLLFYFLAPSKEIKTTLLNTYLQCSNEVMQIKQLTIMEKTIFIVFGAFSRLANR